MEGISLNFQVGRTYINCKIQKPVKLFNCCNIEENFNLLYYYNQNEKQIQKHMNLIVKKDYNELDNESENDYKINNTFEQKYLINIDEKYNYNSLEAIEKDKISDNEYFFMKHQKLKKDLTRALIDEDENDKNINKCENKDIEKNTDNEEENENDENEEKNNKSEENNNEKDSNINNEDKSSTQNNNQNENKNINPEDIESVCVSENNETMKKENDSNLD